MMLKVSIIVILLLGTFAVSDSVRIRCKIAAEKDEEEDTKTLVVEDEIAKAFKDGATSAARGTEADSAGAPITASEFPVALVQEIVSQVSVLSPAMNISVEQQLVAVAHQSPSNRRKVQSARAPRSIFSDTLDYLKKRSMEDPRVHFTVLKAACDSHAFSCEEIILLASFQRFAYEWARIAKLFAEGRNSAGCISDPANAKSIVDSFESRWYIATTDLMLIERLDGLKQAFIYNEGLKPAKDVEPPPMQLQTGIRTEQDIEKLVGDMEKLQLIVRHNEGEVGYQPPYEPLSITSVNEFTKWLKQIRVQGEQFSGPQLVTLVNAIPSTSQGVPVLLQYLEQYVTGVTCSEVKHIMLRSIAGGVFFVGALRALKANIVDGQNKVEIVKLFEWSDYVLMNKTEEVLQDVGLGLPPKNNPIFGVVKGNPVIFVVDESTSMDTKFSLGADIFTRREFCHNQLETVLEGLPHGTYFNVIQYSSSAVKIFSQPVVVNKTTVDAAMEAVSRTWRSNYAPGQDPVEMLQNMKAFALKLKYQLNRSSQRKSKEALQLAYATADVASHQTDDRQQTPHLDGPLEVTKDLPQIYFLTSGQPDGGAHQIIHNIDEFDQGRNIPVNTIAFIMPAEHVARQFGKDLASKTGGFFRAIEQPSLCTNKRKRELPES